MLRYDLFISDVYRRRREEGGGTTTTKWIDIYKSTQQEENTNFLPEKKPREAFPRDTRKASCIDLTQNLNSFFFP